MDKFIKILRLILLGAIFLWGVILVSIRADHKPERRQNIIDKVILSLAEAPQKVKRYLNRTEYLEKPFTLTDDLFAIGSVPEEALPLKSIYSLHYNYMGDDKGVFCLQNIKTGDKDIQWTIDLNEVLNDCNIIDKNIKSKNLKVQHDLNDAFYLPKKLEQINLYSPILLEDSALLFHCMFGYVYKVDKHSNIIWKSKKISHHSMEIDQNENIWTCSTVFDNEYANENGYLDDAILCLDRFGNELFFRSISDILKSNGLFDKLYGYEFNKNKPIIELDPYHLNDVLPISSNGKFWNEGDLFLSLRTPDMVILYRPSNDSILWSQRGPWNKQHDVNVINDSTISIFNNNVLPANTSPDNKNVFLSRPTSNIAIYDFESGITDYFAGGIFNSKTGGRQIYLDNGFYIVEESSTAKYWIINQKGESSGKYYIPFFTNPSTGQVSCWARIYLKENNHFIMQ